VKVRDPEAPSPVTNSVTNPVTRELRLLPTPATAVDAGAARTAAPFGPDARFSAIYEAWFDDVTRWLYALGVPSSDTEDLAQEIFLVVRRKLDRFDGGNLAGWLYRIAQLTVRDHRRRAWFKNLTQRRQEVDLADLPPQIAAHPTHSPAQSYEEAENRQRLQALVAKMSEKLRTTFVLFEIEGYSGEEIAELQDVPLGTVWTRLHHARKAFWKLVRQQEGAS
jgi:RNA polymerase sigma-70 factor (ECF subfamily)